MEAVSAKDLKTRVALLLWGDSKVGKTTYAMSLPGKKLIVNFDPDGFLSVADRDDFDVIDLAQETPSDAINKGKKVGTFLEGEPGVYGSVIVDSTTTLVEASVGDAVYRGVGKSTKFMPTLEQPGLTAWGARNINAVDIVNRLLRATAKLKIPIIFLAHADDPEFDEAGKNVVRQTIMLSAKIRNNAGLKVSEIWHMAQASGDRRVLYLAPFGVKTPMGSRIFNTEKVPKFNLTYDPDKPYEEQACSLTRIIQTWEEGGRKKLTEAPK